MDILDFYNAVSSGNLEKIKQFQSEKNGNLPLNKNITYACGATFILPLPLIVAFQHNRLDVAKFLIENGADLDTICKKYGKSPRELMPKDFIC